MVREAGVTAEQANAVLALAELTGTNDEVLNRVEQAFAAAPTEKAAEGLRLAEEAGLPNAAGTHLASSILTALSGQTLTINGNTITFDGSTTVSTVGSNTTIGLGAGTTATVPAS